MLREAIADIITELETLTDETFGHQQRKALFLALHDAKNLSRKEGLVEVVDELVALEYSLGYGQTEERVEWNELASHCQRLATLMAIDYFPSQEEVESEVPDSATEPELSIEDSETVSDTYDPIQLILCNCTNRDEAREIARGLVEARLAACVNIIANIGAIYRWQDEIHDTAECQLQIKTTPQRQSEIKNFIEKQHTNEVPEIICITLNEGNQAYFEWVKQETAG